MEEKNNFSRPGDYRTAAIAMLTTVIVMALFHFGAGLVRIFSDCYEPKPQIILISSDSPRRGPEHRMGPRGDFRRGQFRQECGGENAFRDGKAPQKNNRPRPQQHPPVAPDTATAAGDNASGE